jgi:hypothetical protein
MQRGTEVCTCTLTFAKGQPEYVLMQSQIENRAKAKEFARLTVVAKSLRHSRQYRKLAEMYWALALGEEPDRAQPSKTNVKKEHDMTTYPIEFHRRSEQKWASRIEQILTITGTAPPPRDPNDDDDDEHEDEEDEDLPDEPAVVREPDED